MTSKARPFPPTDHTHVAGVEVRLLGAHQDGRVGDRSVLVLHLLILVLVFVLDDETRGRYSSHFFKSCGTPPLPQKRSDC